MFAKFFIERPVLANVIALVIILLGGVAMFSLPVAQYPPITPPTVQVTAPGAGTPTGTVTFKDGTTSLATSTLSSGQATFTTSTLSAASHSMTAVYNGDANFNTNTSAVLTQTVIPLPTATVSGGGTVCQGDNIGIQAALTGSAPWTVVWSDGVIQTNIAVSPATRMVRPSSTTTYTVTSVSGANCSGTSTGSATVTVNPAVALSRLVTDTSLGFKQL
jgi:hypothetical protein